MFFFAAPMAQVQSGTDKISWRGRIVGIQPRIRLLRSFDQRNHSYQGYVLSIHGACDEQTGEFKVAIGKAAHKKHQLRVGMELSGLAVAVADPRLETAEFYKVSGIKVLEGTQEIESDPPPFLGTPPSLDEYRSRGHRRLDTRTYGSTCSSCIWGCRMPVEMTIDQWNPSQRKYRFETFCYGPKSCPLYRAGPNRKVPGRKGMSYTEEDWVDEDATAHRGGDD